MPTLVEVVPYNDIWPCEFERISDKLWQLLGDLVVAVDHVGSTSVPGLCAKPITDVGITICELADVDPASDILVENGYEVRGNRYDDEVWGFIKTSGSPKQRVYLCPPANETHSRRILFRDYLRANTETAHAYAALKRDLASKYPYDGDGYTAAKTHFISEVVERARATRC